MDVREELNSADENPDSVARTVRTWAIVSFVFVAVSLLSVPVPGINEPHYLTKARAFVDGDWCKPDFFLQSANAHFVFFALTGPLTTVFSFSVVAVIGRVVSLSILGLGWTMLAGRLRLSASAAVFAAAVFCGIAMTGNLSGEWVVGGFEGKVPSWGFGLIGVALWFDAWRSRSHAAYAFAGAMMGLSVCLHPVVGVWFCIGIALSEVVPALMFRSKTSGLEPCTPGRFLVNGIVFTLTAILVALPGLVPAAAMVLSSEVEPESADRANYIQVFWRLAHHLDPSTFPVRAWVHSAVLVGVICLLMWYTRRLRQRAEQATEADARGRVPRRSLFWRPLLVLLSVAFLFVLGGTAIGWHADPILEVSGWQWRGDLLKFYPFRFFDGLLPMTAALSAALALDTLTFRSSDERRRAAAMVLIVVVFGAAFYIRPKAPAGYTAEEFSEWQKACEWLKGNTPEDALILGPREGFGLKWFGERAEYVCFKDCPQDAAGILEWNSRLWTIHRWSATAYKDEVYDRKDTRKLHQTTGITHILTRKLGPFEQSPVYQNSVWRIYRVAD